MARVALYGQLKPYEPGTDSWEDYIEIMEHYFAANDIDDDERKVSIFCSTVGAKTYRLAKSLCLPKKIQECLFDEIVENLNKHYEPKPTEATESLKFGKRDRKPGESIQVYVAELRKVAEHCNFGSFLDRALRDRLLTGCNDVAMQRELLKIPNDKFNLKRAVEVCEALEASSRNLKEIQATAGHGSEPVNKVLSTRPSGEKRGGGTQRQEPRRARMGEDYWRKEGGRATERGRNENPTPRESTKTCWRCGKTDHNPRDCFFKDQKCFKCRKWGHAKAVCKENSPVNYVQEREEYGEDEEDDEYDEELFLGGVNHIQSKIPPIKASVMINGTEVQCELDTGCPVTILNQTTGTELFGSTLGPSEYNLKSYTGHTLDVKGSTSARIKYQDRECEVPVIIVKSPGQANLLGRDALLSLSMIEIKQIREDNPCSPSMEEVLSRHESVFRDELGTLKGTTAKIQVNPEAQPKFYKPRSLPYALRSKVDDELDRLVSENIIEPVTFSDWAAPVVPVLKPDGHVRLCGDYKVTINQASKLEQYPLPTLDDLCLKLAGGKKFTKLDLSHAYFQLTLSDESKKFTTINTHRGLFQYNRLPFGISSAPAIFQRTIESLLQGIDHVAAYIDDIILTGRSDAEHVATLDRVLQRLEDAGLRLKKSKCTFLAREVTYLGHRIDENGIHPLQGKVDAVLKARAPSNVSELKSFLGLLNYYGKFLPDLSTRLAPLHKLLRKDQKWSWKREQQESFEAVKKLLLSAEVLAHYDPTKEITLQCDASPYGVGAVLSVREKNGTERPVGFASKSLNDAERNYSQLDREGLAVIFGLKKFHKFLFGRPFVIITDHKPLITLFNELKQVPSTASLRIQRWALLLRGYEYRIEYRPGQCNGNADCLSRLPLPVTTVAKEEDRVLLIEELDHSPVTAFEVERWTSRDPTLANVREYVQREWPEDDTDPALAPYKMRKDELSVQDGVLLWGARVIVPPQGRERVAKELHESHPGLSRMKALARSYVWWPKMENDLEQMVKGCETCQLNRNAPATAPLHPWERPERPWSRIHIDYAGPISGNMILVQVCATTKWIEASVMRNMTAEETVEQLRETFARHGIPEVIISDNASNFTGTVFEEFMRKNGIVHMTSAPYHPSSNGLAERAVQTVKQGLKKTPGDSVRTKLNRFLFQYRMTPSSTTGRSPAELLNNRKMRSLLDLIHPNLQGKVFKKQAEMKARHDSYQAVRKFCYGERVSVKNFATGAKWLPGAIHRVTGPVSYEVQLQDGRIVRRHVDHVISRQAQLPSWAAAPATEPLLNEEPPVSKTPNNSHEEGSNQASTSTAPTSQVALSQGQPMSEAPVSPSPSQLVPIPTAEGPAPVRRSARQIKLPSRLQDYELNSVDYGH